MERCGVTQGGPWCCNGMSRKILFSGKLFEEKIRQFRQTNDYFEELMRKEEDEHILLSKEANAEQLVIAQRLEQHGAVLVQGPPGTGKTHTIANLIGHLLAQGKSILVTSHTSWTGLGSSRQTTKRWISLGGRWYGTNLNHERSKQEGLSLYLFSKGR